LEREKKSGEIAVLRIKLRKRASEKAINEESRKKTTQRWAIACKGARDKRNEGRKSKGKVKRKLDLKSNNPERGRITGERNE